MPQGAAELTAGAVVGAAGSVATAALGAPGTVATVVAGAAVSAAATASKVSLGAVTTAANLVIVGGTYSIYMSQTPPICRCSFGLFCDVHFDRSR